jgi:hypothetical protein
VSLLLFEGGLLVGLVVGDAVNSSWKIVNRHELLLHECCEVVVKFAISEMKEKLAIRKKKLSFVELA